MSETNMLKSDATRFAREFTAIDGDEPSYWLIRARKLHTEGVTDSRELTNALVGEIWTDVEESLSNNIVDEGADSCLYNFALLGASLADWKSIATEFVNEVLKGK